MEYRYPRFRRELMKEDSAFTSGPAPGEPFPGFDLPTIDGRRVTKEEMAGKPFLVTLSSFT